MLDYVATHRENVSAVDQTEKQANLLKKRMSGNSHFSPYSHQAEVSNGPVCFNQ